MSAPGSHHLLLDGIHWAQIHVVAPILTADRTLASYLWQTCRGGILVLTLTSIIPGRLHGWTGRVLRFPVLGMVYLMIVMELMLYGIIRFLIRALEWIFANSKHRQLRLCMAKAQSYKEWYAIAQSLDVSQGRHQWTTIVNDDTAYRYSWPFIFELLKDLQSSRQTNDVPKALAVLQQCTRKNVGGIMSEDMFSYTNAGEPKVLVEEFVTEVADTLRWVTDATMALPTGTSRTKLEIFLKRARAAYGRTALCLSGGAMMGNYHFGAVRALLETGLLPHIISGTSAGSVIGAMLCTRTDEELRKELTPEVLYSKMSIFESSWMERCQRFWKHGSMFDPKDWDERVRYFTNGYMTFEEAYKKTGRVLCITLSATTKKAPPVLINYITAPNVTIASAVLASAAVPGFVDPMKLQVKDENGVIRNQGKQDEEYRDGSIESDIPINGLAEMLNCQFFLAAQANPHIVPFFYNSKGDVGRPSRWSSGMRDDSWRGGFLLSALEMYLKNDMRSKFNLLNDLEVAIGFTSTMMTQQTYSGTTTIVPQVCLLDYFKLFADQTVDDMKRYFQGGSVAAYQHVAMLKLHYKIAHALDECLAILEEKDDNPTDPPRRRKLQLINKQNKLPGLHYTTLSTPRSESTIATADDEYESGGFDGVECAFGPGRTSPMDF